MALFRAIGQTLKTVESRVVVSAAGYHKNVSFTKMYVVIGHHTCMFVILLYKHCKTNALVAISSFFVSSNIDSRCLPVIPNEGMLVLDKFQPLINKIFLERDIFSGAGFSVPLTFFMVNITI